MGAEGWGMHAIPGFSLRKIFPWVGAPFVELALVKLWLVQVGHQGLQVSLIPIASLTTMVFIALAIPQVLGAA
jgi:hypothetical protein